MGDKYPPRVLPRTQSETEQPSDKLGSDFPMSVERGCGATGKGGTHDAPGQPAQDSSIPDDAIDEALDAYRTKYGLEAATALSDAAYEQGKANALAEVRARVKDLRTPTPVSGESGAILGYNAAIKEVLTAIDGEAER